MNALLGEEFILILIVFVKMYVLHTQNENEIKQYVVSSIIHVRMATLNLTRIIVCVCC